MSGTGNLILAAAAMFAAISVFVLTLLIRLVLRRGRLSSPARAGANRKMLRELGWTTLWVMMAAAVVVPALRLLYLQSSTREADLTIRVTGKLWYWTYEYPDRGHFGFDVPMLAASAPVPRGDHIVVPVGETVRIVTIGTDLIYSWAIPAIGAKVVGLPGRDSESWFKAGREGVYFGECTELCALRHAFKPVEIEVVSRERFERWAAERLAAVTPLIRTAEDMR